MTIMTWKKVATRRGGEQLSRAPRIGDYFERRGDTQQRQQHGHQGGVALDSVYPSRIMPMQKGARTPSEAEQDSVVDVVVVGLWLVVVCGCCVRVLLWLIFVFAVYCEPELGGMRRGVSCCGALSVVIE
jgi:hypothetical protein